MKIRAIKPCSEFAGKLIVICELGHSLNPQKISDHLRSANKIKAIFFEKYNLAWISSNTKRIIVRNNGEIIINGAEDIDDAKKTVKEIERVARIYAS
jgi:ArsR family metal-binding transcriptional regulator